MPPAVLLPDLYNNVAVLKAKSGYMAEAEQFLLRALEQVPVVAPDSESVEHKGYLLAIRYNLALLYFRMNDPARGNPQLGAVKTLSQYYQDAYLLQAEVLYDQGLFELAIA